MPKARQVWSKENCRGNLDLSSDGLQALYRGPVGHPDEQAKMAGSVRAVFPFPAKGCWYFEIKVINPGDTGIIGIGLMEKESRLSDMPGWGIFTDDYGYHADDASIVTHATPIWTVNDQEFDGRFGKDDIVGCGIHWDLNGGSIFFTKNGTLIAAPVHSVARRELFPSVGILSTKGEIRANFGTVRLSSSPR
ncbi:hypothetical protein BT69DRAFT_22959 [Atractiella rhizophila]|nr:hypothetical protein BT69DRAFT_22959 [Atractiella rhizophila]